MDEMQKLIVDIASELISIPGHNELDVWEQNTALGLAALLRRHGVGCEVVEAAPCRHNVIAAIKGGSGPRLLLTTHIDTVPPGGMADAHTPVVRDGRLYGRGSVDARGPLACMAAVMIYLQKHKITPSGDVLFAAVADEESGSIGMRSLVKSEDMRPDLVVIGETTNLDVCIAHNGAMWAEVSFLGKAAHGSEPEQGINAVYKAADFISAVRQELIPKLNARRHPLIGPSTINIGVINGGTRPTIVPACCTVSFDRRYIPGESFESVVSELNALLEELAGKDSDFRYDFSVTLGDKERPLPPLDISPDHPAVRKACETITRVLGKEPAVTGAVGWGDSALATAFWKVPALTIGPGDIAQAHSQNEYVELGQLFSAYEVYKELALSTGKWEEIRQ